MDVDAKKNIYTSDKNNREEGEIINGIPSKISAEECENYFQKMLNDLIDDIDGSIANSNFKAIPPAIPRTENLNTSPTSLTACKFEHRSKKKVAIVTPEQRTKKRIPNDIFEPLKIKQDEHNLSPSFSSKQLLSSIISKKLGMVNEMIELSDHQIFSMDCKRTVEGLSRYNTCVNNNNEEKGTNFV